jgi:hypothetical protein
MAEKASAALQTGERREGWGESAGIGLAVHDAGLACAALRGNGRFAGSGVANVPAAAEAVA